MTHTTWNTSGSNPVSAEVRSVSALVFLSLALLGFPATLPAADEQLGPFLFVSSTRAPKDIEIEARIRRALRQDAQLRPLNLGVHVSGGIAKLSGPVPAVELQKRALKITGRVEGVLTVSDRDLYISAAEQIDKRLSVRIQDDPPTQTRAASPLTPLGGAVAPRLLSDSRSESATGETGRRIILLAPEITAPPARVPEAARLTANPHPVSPTVSIAAAIENLRQREARYQQLRARVQDATVFIFAGDTASEDAMTFAQAVRRLPGVQHVILNSGSR